MKEQAIRKINRAGKIFSVVTRILKVVLLVCLIVTFVGAIVLFALPGNLITFRVKGAADVQVDVSDLTKENFSDEDKERISSNLFKHANIQYEGVTLNISGVTVGDRSFRFQADGEIADFGMGKLRVIVVVSVLYMAAILVILFFAGALAKAFQYCKSPFEENVVQKMQRLAYSLIPWTLISGVSGPTIWKGDVGISIEISPLLTMGIILALSYVFKYGAVLQQESDKPL